MVTIQPVASSGPVLNPGKGWVLYGMPTQQTAQELALGNLGYQRFEWAQLEPEEGRFDWGRLDAFIAAWAAVGKPCAFGVMTANAHSRQPGGFVTPKWVFDAGAGYRVVETKDLPTEYAGNPGAHIVPDFGDPVFVEKLRAFVDQFGRRYDGNPHIAFVDIRCYGNWGEGHLYPWGGDLLSPEKYKEQIQFHLDAFTKTRLCLSCENSSSHYADLYDWATALGIAARRDGICGNSDGGETARAFGRAPGVFEFFGHYEFMKSKGWWDGVKDNVGSGHTLEECVKNGMPSYIQLTWWGSYPQRFLDAERPLIERLANRMGYHLVLTKAVFPARPAAAPSKDTIELEWRNDGVAPIYVPCVVALALLNKDGSVAAVQYPSECVPAHWLPGQVVRETARLSSPGVAPGAYRLAIGLVPHVGDTVPAIQLAIEGERRNGWYLLGDLTL